MLVSLFAFFSITTALNSVQVVNTNANLHSSNSYPHYSRPNNNQFYVSGAVRSYQQGGYYPYQNEDSYYPNQGYRFRRQSSISPLVKEANTQYQYQGINQYDEKVNPIRYYESDYAPQSYADAYRFREHNQYQLQGNAQSRTEGDPRYADQFNNRYQSQQQSALYRQRYNY